MKKLNSILILMLIISVKLLAQEDVFIVPINDSITLELERQVFQESNHIIKRINETDFLIDNQIVFGTDGEIPKTYLKSAVINIKDNKIDLETSSMYNPWFGIKPNQASFGIIQDGTHLKIKGLFSDAAGSYGVEWLIIGNTSIRTILTYDEQILFEYLKY